MKSRVLRIICPILLLAGSVAVHAAQLGDFEYETDGTQVTITQYIGPSDTVTIPETIAGLPVTCIGDWAFVNYHALSSVAIPKTVTRIGSHGIFLGCQSLATIEVDGLNPTLSSFEGVLFNKNRSKLIRCPSGKGGSYVVPDSVTTIEYGAFWECSSLTNLTIPDSVTSIEAYALYYCTGLTSITIPNGVVSIGFQAFSDCTSLTSITIPDSVTDLGGGAFRGCASLTNATIGNGITALKSAVSKWPCGTFTGCTALLSITLSTNLSFIDGYSFYNCASLAGVTIPNGMTNIDTCAFRNCTSLTTVTIPDSVTYIGARVFEGCAGLTAIVVDVLNPFYSSADGVLFDRKQTMLMECPGGKEGRYVIPDSVTTIGQSAFSRCDGLTSVTIPDSVTTIGERAFADCSSLTKATIPDGVTSLEPMTFSGCTSLTSVTIGNGVASIGYAAFSECTGLRGVYFHGRAPFYPAANPPFYEANRAANYYLPGTTGWGSTFADRPTALWIPLLPNLPSITPDNPLRLVTHSPAPATVRVQRSTDLLDWEDWQTVSRDSGPSELQDTEAGTTPYRFYRGIGE